ncbi:hypothetical protein [Geomonas paludis]|uniref:Uncharacterized protein n=1 Tax=Geomonas paludis TaxID=2740185 RepID=A0A6V8MQI8_9BACT|nr:hypothetical protein [Geomonas paludis]GFO62328.1 hypothetical protein GMPD_02470 [Geomonas paludis]
MVPEEIVTTLCGKLPDPSEVVYVVTMRDLLAAIVRRLREDSLRLTVEDLHLARDEVQAVFGHYLDEHELLNLALDQWEIVRHL